MALDTPDFDLRSAMNKMRRGGDEKDLVILTVSGCPAWLRVSVRRVAEHQRKESHPTPTRPEIGLVVTTCLHWSIRRIHAVKSVREYLRLRREIDEAELDSRLLLEIEAKLTESPYTVLDYLNTQPRKMRYKVDSKVRRNVGGLWGDLVFKHETTLTKVALCYALRGQPGVPREWNAAMDRVTRSFQGEIADRLEWLERHLK